MFFLGLRNALFVGIAIPMSMLMSFVILNAIGITLNTIVLFALVLALGMLVDNGIVVVENIYRFMDEGYSRIEAAKLGAGEVALPIIASTATTLAAFLPLALDQKDDGIKFIHGFTTLVQEGIAVVAHLRIEVILAIHRQRLEELHAHRVRFAVYVGERNEFRNGDGLAVRCGQTEIRAVGRNRYDFHRQGEVEHHRRVQTFVLDLLLAVRTERDAWCILVQLYALVYNGVTVGCHGDLNLTVGRTHLFPEQIGRVKAVFVHANCNHRGLLRGGNEGDVTRLRIQGEGRQGVRVNRLQVGEASGIAYAYTSNAKAKFTGRNQFVVDGVVVLLVSVLQVIDVSTGTDVAQGDRDEGGRRVVAQRIVQFGLKVETRT